MMFHLSKILAVIWLGMSLIAMCFADTDYKVRARDVLGVIVVGQTDLSKDLTVLDDGTISYPYLGSVKVDGLTTDQIKRKIVEALKVYYVKPEVSVTVTKAHAITASGNGALSKPGTVELTPNSRLLDLVAQCGGLATNLKPEWARGTFVHDGKSHTVDMSALLSGHDPASNLPVQDGDVFLVQEVDPDLRQVKLVGEVTRPGAVDVVGPTTFASLIASAGGTTSHAAMSHVLVTHGNKTTVVDLHKLMLDGSVPGDVLVYPGDTVIIPATTLKFSVVGAVRSPGTFDYPENDSIDLLRAIAAAGGQSDTARLNSVRVEKGSIVKTYNLSVLLAKGGASLIKIDPGDVVFVPSSNPVRLSEGAGLLLPLLYLFHF